MNSRDKFLLFTKLQASYVEIWAGPAKWVHLAVLGEKNKKHLPLGFFLLPSLSCSSYLKTGLIFRKAQCDSAFVGSPFAHTQPSPIGRLIRREYPLLRPRFLSTQGRDCEPNRAFIVEGNVWTPTWQSSKQTLHMWILPHTGTMSAKSFISVIATGIEKKCSSPC